MSERDVYYEMLPQIAECIVECRKMSDQAYVEWKIEVLDQCPESIKVFIKKVIAVIDVYRNKKEAL